MHDFELHLGHLLLTSAGPHRKSYKAKPAKHAAHKEFSQQCVNYAELRSIGIGSDGAS